MSLVVSFLEKTIFGNKMESVGVVDPRVPTYFMQVPLPSFKDKSSLSTTTPTPTELMIGFAGLEMDVWLQLFALTVVHLITTLITGVLVYYYVVKQRGTLTSYLVGWGVACPIFLYLPYALLQGLDLRNPVIILGAASSPILQIFKCWEAISGTMPDCIEKGPLSLFLLYFPATAQLELDPTTGKPVPLTAAEIKRKLYTIALLFLESTALYSLLMPYNYHFFTQHQSSSSFITTNDTNNTTPTNILHYFHWATLLNSYLLGALTKVTMENGLMMYGLLTSLVGGINTVDINASPLTASTSPSDFWGRRWNKLVSTGLKRAVLKPLLCQGYSRLVANLAVFVVSGLMHEYLLTMTASRGTSLLSNDRGRYMPFSGSHLLFFVWNAVILVLDGILGKTPLFQWMSRNIPAPLRTLLVFLTVLPVASLFTEDYISLGLYNGFAQGFPRLYWKLQ